MRALKEYLRKRICRIAHTDEILQELSQIKVENANLKRRIATNDFGGGTDVLKILKRLQAVNEESSCVELIQLNEIQLFFFKNDLITTLQNEEMRRNLGAKMFCQDAMTGRNVIPILLEHYLKYDLNAGFIDIGCQYGHESILTGLYLKKRQKKIPIYCFDIGRTRDLMPYNIALNDMEDIISFYPIAVSDSCKPIIVYWKPGYSENNKMKNPNLGAPSESYSYVLPSTTIDSFVTKNSIDANLIIKIDVEGSEPSVLQGMRQTLTSKLVSFIFEYSPYNFDQKTNFGLDFLQEIAKTHLLIFIGKLEGVALGSGWTCCRMSSNQLPKFTQHVAEKVEGAWCDLLALPKNLPALKELLEKTNYLNLG